MRLDHGPVLAVRQGTVQWTVLRIQFGARHHGSSPYATPSRCGPCKGIASSSPNLAPSPALGLPNVEARKTARCRPMSSRSRTTAPTSARKARRCCIRIRFAKRLPHSNVARSGSPLGPKDTISEQLHAVQLVNTEHSCSIEYTRHVLEGHRNQVCADQRNIGGKSGNPLVDVIERLQIGKLHHYEECLLEWISNGRSL